jgi:dTDP-4-dehydrorhamnose 3,5-epimerase
MKVIETNVQGALLLEPKVFGDSRGFFLESWNRKTFSAIGLDIDFVQDNHSRSQHGVLRGLHYQTKHPQGKLVRVASGAVFDVAVDLRRSSPTFGRWAGAILSAENQRMFWIPPGFAHGFLVLSEYADFLYKASDYYSPEHERSILWNDLELAIEWPLENLSCSPTLAAKDAAGISLQQAEAYP